MDLLDLRFGKMVTMKAINHAILPRNLSMTNGSHAPCIGAIDHEQQL